MASAALSTSIGIDAIRAAWHIEVAKKLPDRLLRVFARCPPAALDPTASAPNPFKRHGTEPVYSLRRQAELVKLARENGVEELLPPSTKGTQARIKAREEGGLRVKGTGVGQKVKGKMWERTLKGRLEKRRQAMLEMPQMIQTWKERGHGRGWKKWPK